jgi:YHS domain-containing protein
MEEGDRNEEIYGDTSYFNLNDFSNNRVHLCTPDYNLPSRLLDTYIIPFLLSKPIQKESASSHSLQKVLQEASRPPASSLTEIPPFAKEISGKTYYFDKEKFSVTFHFPNNEAGSITTELNGMKRTYSFGYNGSYLTFNDQAQLSPYNHVVATATFDQSSLILQQRSLQESVGTLVE